MPSLICEIDDKYVPVYRVLWVAAVPHFCGEDDCVREGQYEVRLEHDETLWANHAQRDELLKMLELWQRGFGDVPD